MSSPSRNDRPAVDEARQHGAAPRRAPWEAADGDEPVNAMSCDVEDYFQVSAFEEHFPREHWDDSECRIPQNIDRILGIYADAGVRGTFFVLGWVASRYPELIRRMAAEGHEIASHGYQHIRVWRQKPEEFRKDALETRLLLEDVSGTAVKGYRAASWSIDHRTPWAHGIIAEAGYEYSSSIYPISHDHFGMPDAPAHPFRTASGILEVPASTVRLMGRNWPAGGGGYFRLLPLSASLWMIRRINERSGMPSLFYYHPWELDPGQPRVEGASSRARFRHYLNLEKFEPRFRALLKAFRWDRMDNVYLGGR